MSDFLHAVETVPFFRHALIAGILSSLSFGVVGTFVVTRNITYISASIAHCILGGIGASIYFSRVWDLPWLTPMVGALAAAVVSALAIGLITLRAYEREDTIIGAIWTVSMAAGLLFIHYAPGPGVNLDSYIFGNILITSRGDVIATGALSLVVLAVTFLFYHQLVAVCFDAEFASLRGVRSGAYYLLLLVLVAISVTSLVRLAGIILATALIVLPAATASRFCRNMWRIMLLATVLSMLYLSGGQALSYITESPTGPVIVMIAAAAYLLSLAKR